LQGSFTTRVLIIGTVLSCVRIAIFGFLIFCEWTGRQSISLLPFILALYPEGLLIKNDVTWSAWGAVGFSVVLLVGSFLWAVPVAMILHLFKR
jgi:hypothetical protein